MVSITPSGFIELPLAGPAASADCACLDRMRDGIVVGPRLQRVRRIRPLRRSARSTAVQLLARGEAVVRPAGNPSVAYGRLKRLVDVVGALALLALLAPIMLLIYAVLWVTTGGKPMFAQTRSGYRGRPFRMLKFRTMRLDADAVRDCVRNEQSGPVFKNRRDPRITRLGRWLRRTSLDETPQLVNVLRGDMSLVGPRPPLPAEVAEYEPWQRRRLAVKPGLTCLWQVSGRCEIDFERWVRLDLWYVANQSLWNDLWLLARTPLSVLSCRGAY